MGREVNIHLIQALEKQIEEGKEDTINLKRTRNSLLNISTRVPPEILGYVFVCSLVEASSRSAFEGLRMGSYNFLLVCHHWFEVASRIPELWSFWGNTLQDWKKRYHRSGAAPLDLVLDEHKCYPDASFDGSLQDAVKCRVIEDTTRQVHLTSFDTATLTSIISSLTPGSDESARNNNIESIIWQNEALRPVDVSNFFSRSRLSKLRLLDLSGRFRMPPWDHLIPRTTLLTTLSLKIDGLIPPPSPSTSQLFSILASNPNLQELSLSGAAFPDDIDGSTLQVPLRDLKLLSLAGVSRRIFGFLRRLVLPEALDSIYLEGFDSPVEDFSQTLGPFIRDYFQRDVRFQDRLKISSSSSNTISVKVEVVCAHTTVPTEKPPWVTLEMDFLPTPPTSVLKQLLIDLIASAPQEHVVSFNTDLEEEWLEELFFMMPNIERLQLSNGMLSKGFLRPNQNGPRADAKLLPSLRSLYLEVVILDSWEYLEDYLIHQTSGGNTISLKLHGDYPYIPLGMVNRIKDLVEEFIYDECYELDGSWSPCSCCYPSHEEDE